MTHKKWLTGAVICCGALALLFSDAMLSRLRQMQEESEEAEAGERWNGYGLPYGEELSEKRLFSNEEVVCYTDRIFTHFVPDGEAVRETVQLCSAVSEELQGIEHFILMPVPPGIRYEEGQEDDRAAYDRFLTELGAEMPEDWILFDMAQCLDAHADEYLYYRTEDSITLLGGLYAANGLAASLGGETLPRDAFRMEQFNTVYGELFMTWVNHEELNSEQRVQMFKMPEDPVCVYMLEGHALDEVLYTTETDSYERPVLMTSWVKDGEAVGNYFQRAVIKGEGRSFPGSVAFVAGDLSARKIAPYLAYYYDAVCMINIDGTDDIRRTVREITAEYGSADFIVAQNAGKLGKPDGSRVFDPFRGEE